jgi:cytochrome P450
MALTQRVGVRLDELAAQRLAEPRNDLLSALVHAEVEGRRLTAAERLGFMLLLNYGANETTRSALAGGMLALLEHPEQFDRLRRDPSLIPTAVEEFLRYVTPLTNLTRTATQDLVLRGQRIREGDTLAMWFISGNRDEEVFTDPHRLDVGRMPNRQLSFGAGGPHHCLGAALARLELRVMFELLVERFTEIRLTGEVVRQQSTFVRGITSMPVTAS